MAIDTSRIVLGVETDLTAWAKGINKMHNDAAAVDRAVKRAVSMAGAGKIKLPQWDVLGLKPPDLTKTLSSVKPPSEGLFSSSFWGNFWAGVAQQGIAAMTAIAGTFQKAIGDAMRMDTAQRAAASDVSVNLGISQKDAKGLNTQIYGELAQVAAKLPGETQDYLDIFQGFSGVLAKENKGNADKFRATAIELSKRAGVLSSIRGLSGIESGTTIERLAAGGSTLGELKRLDFIQKNTQFRAALTEGAAANGGPDNWTKLTTGKRLEIIQKALEAATPDSLIKDFEGSAESLIQGWKSALIDPNSGALGLLRKLPNKGGRSGLDAIAQLLGKLDGLMQAVAPLLGLGNVDAMAGLIDWVDWLGGWVDKLTAATKSSGLDGFAQALAQFYNAGVSGALRMIESVDWVRAGQTAGALIVRFLTTLDYAQLLSVGIRGVIALGKGIAGVLIGLVPAVGRALLDGVKALPGGIMDSVTKVIDWIKNQVASLLGQAQGAMSGAAAGGLATAGAVAMGLPVPPVGSTEANTTNNASVTVNATTGASAEDIAAQAVKEIGGMFSQAKAGQR